MDIDIIKKAMEGNTNFQTGLHITKKDFRKFSLSGYARIKTSGEDITKRLAEEPAELVQAILKMDRKISRVSIGDRRINLIEEIADTILIIGILMVQHNINEDEICDMIRLKEFAQSNPIKELTEDN